ncbi:hypothetical protein SLA2020_067590 [Shorea laevis]
MNLTSSAKIADDFLQSCDSSNGNSSLTVPTRPTSIFSSPNSPIRISITGSIICPLARALTRSTQSHSAGRQKGGHLQKLPEKHHLRAPTKKKQSDGRNSVLYATQTVKFTE